MEVWFIIFGSVLSVVGAMGNGLVVLLIAKYRRLHSPANWFVLSLAVADCAVGIVVFPSSYVCNGEATAAAIKCDMIIHNAAYWFFVNSSIANLCILTWNRYISIVHPFKYISSMTARHPGRVILLAWLIPLMISLSLVLGMHVTSSPTALKVLRLTGVSGFDILSCALLIYAVVRILVVVRAQLLKYSASWLIKREFVSSQPEDQVNKSSTETVHPSGPKHNSARFIIAIVVFFLGCQVAINYLVLRYMFVSERPRYFGLVVTILLIANSAVNPLVYAFLKQDIKKEIARFIQGRKERRSNNNERSGNLTQMSLFLMREI